jgi:hypothetical protein
LTVKACTSGRPFRKRLLDKVDNWKRSALWSAFNGSRSVLTDNGGAIVGESFTKLDKCDSESRPGDFARDSTKSAKLLLCHLIILIELSRRTWYFLNTGVDRATSETFLCEGASKWRIRHGGLCNYWRFVGCDGAHLGRMLVMLAIRQNRNRSRRIFDDGDYDGKWVIRTPIYLNQGSPSSRKVSLEHLST